MKKLLLLFPNQLFTSHPDIDPTTDEIALLEDELFFSDHQYPVNFHKKKLILHRASMQSYAHDLQEKGTTVHYFNWQPQGLNAVFNKLTTDFKHYQLVLYDSVDYSLNQRLKHLCQTLSITPIWQQSKLFINKNRENQGYRQSKKRWFMADFYQHQRRRLDILMTDNKPNGGKWSFDEDNRKKIPKKERVNIPLIHFPKESHWVIDARTYVTDTFPQALGNDKNFEYPINHADAKCWLDSFLEQRFEKFGVYEDALVPQRGWLYHSILTPMLNIGLLSPETVINCALEHAAKNSTPIASVEGFVRQIIGWREFMRATYVDLGTTMRNTNHWQHKRKIPATFYTGTTGIKPIDDVIKRTLDSAYCHHIERLMVLGGFMFLCEFDPDDIYKWFMELFIDAYDWVMVPNVYAMSQNADGGLITTKPYFSGSSYLKKMGYDDFDKKNVNQEDGDWCQIWDGLYWRWINLHQQELAKNPRWAMMCAMARKMDAEKMAAHQEHANRFLTVLDQS